MPISFPIPPREAAFFQIPFLFAKPFDVIQAPNYTSPALGAYAEVQRGTSLLQQGGITNSIVRQFNRGGNLRSLGKQYVDVTSASRINPVAKAKAKTKTNARSPFFWDGNYGKINKQISGISRNSSGAILGNCTIMVFRTSERTLHSEVESRSDGSWSINTLESGPFFIVGYKVGAPDVSSTSLNTLTSELVIYD